MILNQKKAWTGRLLTHGVYLVRAGVEGHLQDEVAAVWGYLAQAAERPISITLLSHTAEHIGDLADMATLSPSGEHCTESWITLSTSGTTGPPKRVRHRLSDVLARKRGTASGRWLLTFAPFLWAGLSVLLHAFKTGSELVVPTSFETTDLVRAGAEERATHVSMTPSLLRRLLLAVGEQELRALPLQQITFGGEAATQPVLNLASWLWPHARISHVYAATEIGDICSVSDGQAGIPEHKFEDARFGFSEEGELYIDGKATGDVWQLRNGRYHFVGRQEELINVGGAKVSPIEVETAALSLRGVEEARAYAVPSPLLGQVVGLDYHGELSETELRRNLRNQLPKIACPAFIRQVKGIALTAAGKTKRIEKG